MRNDGSYGVLPWQESGRGMSDDPPVRKRPSGLGRGLSSLLGEVAQEAPVSGGVAPARAAGRFSSAGQGRGAKAKGPPRGGIHPDPGADAWGHGGPSLA